jgi:hypothetical protein
VACGNIRTDCLRVAEPDFRDGAPSRSIVPRVSVNHTPRAKLQDRQQSSDTAEMIQLSFFVVRQLPAKIAVGQLVHSGTIVVAELQLEDALSRLFRHGNRRTVDPFPDVRFGKGRSDSHGDCPNAGGETK